MTNPASHTNQMLSTQEVARLLALQPCTLSAWREDGSQPGLAVFKPGKAVRYRYGDILSFIATRKASSTLTGRQMAPASAQPDPPGRIPEQPRTRKRTKHRDDRQPSLF